MQATEEQLHRLVGMADLFELLSIAFAYPTEHLAAACANGALMADWRACWADATGGAWEGAPDLPEADYEAMRVEYSRLFLKPGENTPIWPYEGAFRYRASGRSGVPGLFRNRACLDVEAQMRAVGVMASDARKVPADSMDKELEFTSWLFGAAARQLDAVLEGEGEFADAPEAQRYADAAAEFARTHVLGWLPDLMAQLREKSRLPILAAFADLGAAALGLLADAA